MPWQDIMRRVLPPTRGVSPHITSAYGALREVGTSPHRGVDFNYYVGPKGQSGINLQQPALRSPVDGVVENAGEGTLGKIAIRDKNGFLHEILHTHSRHVAIGDPVAAGQLIGTMGNTGVKKPNGQPGDHHVHYQMWDPAGNRVNPTDFWDRQGLADSDPSPPAYLDEYQQYLRGLANAADGIGNVPGRARTRNIINQSGTSAFDEGAPAVPFASSDDPDFSGGLPGRLAAVLADGDPGDGSPFIIGEFVAHDSSPQFGGLNHGSLPKATLLARSSWYGACGQKRTSTN